MPSGNLPRWEDNYAPFYCPENPLPRRPRRPPTLPPRLVSPLVRQPVICRTPSRQQYNTLTPQGSVAPRYGRNPDELPSEQFQIFSRGDKNGGMFACTACCCFLFIVPSVVLILAAAIGPLSTKSMWLSGSIAVLSSLFLVIVCIVHFRDMSAQRRRLNSSVDVHVSSPPQYSQVDHSSQQTTDSPPSYTAHPSADTQVRLPSSPTQSSTHSQSAGRTACAAIWGQIAPTDQPPTYNEVVSSGVAHEQEEEQLPLLSSQD